MDKDQYCDTVTITIKLESKCDMLTIGDYIEASITSKDMRGGVISISGIISAAAIGEADYVINTRNI